MKIFADTNVLVSAFAARGLCADLLQVIMADHQLMTGEFELEELERVLAIKLKVPEKKIARTVHFLRQHHVEPVPDTSSEIRVRVEDDQWILQSAIQAKADILVTGDKDLLDISDKVARLRIISPRGFWDLLRK